ncbi:menaquinone reductase molybdopterin-binding-like subunit QrcB [Desulfovulcanus sp.]
MGLDRRGFITFLVGGAAGTLFTPVPWKLLDDVSIWSQNWPWIPRLKYGAKGVTPTTCKLCPAGCGLDVNTVGKRPVTAEGNVEHPLSQGGICPLGSAAVQLLYSPARVKGPLKNNGGKFESISWEEAGKILAEKLSGVKGSGNVAFISGDENGTANEVLAAFLSALGSSDYYFMPSDAGAYAVAWNKIMGGQGQIGFDLENSDYVLMLGADLLSSWGTVVRNQKVFGQKKGQFVYAGPVQTGSASVANKWVPVLPGKESTFALGLAYYILRAGRTCPGKYFAEFKEYILSNYTPSKVQDLTGVPAKTIQKVAAELMSARRPVIVSGSDFGQGSGSLDMVAGIFLNLLLGRLNQRGGLVALPNVQALDKAPDLNQLRQNSLIDFINDVQKGAKQPKVLFIYEANPLYALPQNSQLASALEKVPFKVSFSTFLDETAAKADLILPTPHFLERLDDAYTPFGVGAVTYSVSTPVIDPIFDTKPTPDFILGLAEEMGVDLGISSFEDALKAKAEKLGADWEELQSGQAYVANKIVYQGYLALPARILPAGLKKASPDYPVYLAPQAKPYIGNTKLATTPFGVVTIREHELKGKDFYVHMNKVTAKELGLKQDNKVKLVSSAGECKALVNITETVMNGVVAAPLGFGHTAWDDFSKGKGDNIFNVLTVTQEKGTGLYVWNNSQVKVVKA